jgi:hypothetical protein
VTRTVALFGFPFWELNRLFAANRNDETFLDELTIVLLLKSYNSYTAKEDTDIFLCMSNVFKLAFLLVWEIHSTEYSLLYS